MVSVLHTLVTHQDHNRVIWFIFIYFYFIYYVVWIAWDWIKPENICLILVQFKMKGNSIWFEMYHSSCALICTPLDGSRAYCFTMTLKKLKVPYYAKFHLPMFSNNISLQHVNKRPRNKKKNIFFCLLHFSVKCSGYQLLVML